MADPYEDGLSDLLIKKQQMIELEKKVWPSNTLSNETMKQLQYNKVVLQETASEIQRTLR